MAAILGVDYCPYDEAEYITALMRAMDAFAQQDIRGDPEVAWQQFLRMQPWMQVWEDNERVQTRARERVGADLMKQGELTAEVSKTAGGSKPSVAGRDVHVAHPQPHHMDPPNRSLMAYNDQMSNKLPKLKGAVEGQKHDTNDCQYITVDELTPERLDENSKESRHVYDVSKAISWAGTTSFIDIGRECYAECEAIRKAAAQAPVQQTEPETVPATTPICSSKKRKLHDSPCHPVNGSAVKKTRKESAAF